MTESLRISVIVPVYRAERFVEEAVASALAQPEVAEVLLVEDGSPDGSLAVCERLAAQDSRVRLLRHPGGANRGAGATRNLGLREARCEWVAFLDADDYYLSGRFATAARLLTEDPTLDGVYDAVGTHFAHDGARNWWIENKRSELTRIKQPLPPEKLFYALVNGRYGAIHTNGIVLRRELLLRFGGFDESLPLSQDVKAWMQAAALGRIAAGELTRPVAMRRLHGENRIYRQSARHHHFAIRMYAGMLVWVHDQGIGGEAIFEIVDRIRRRQNKRARELHAPVRWLLAEIWLVLKLTLRRPQLLSYPAFRQWLMKNLRPDRMARVTGKAIIRRWFVSDIERA